MLIQYLPANGEGPEERHFPHFGVTLIPNVPKDVPDHLAERMLAAMPDRIKQVLEPVTEPKKTRFPAPLNGRKTIKKERD